jgi:hypothetical protein
LGLVPGGLVGRNEFEHGRMKLRARPVGVNGAGRLAEFTEGNEGNEEAEEGAQTGGKILEARSWGKSRQVP